MIPAHAVRLYEQEPGEHFASPLLPLAASQENGTVPFFLHGDRKKWRPGEREMGTAKSNKHWHYCCSVNIVIY